MKNFNLKAGTTYLRLVGEEDAEFICSLRNDEKLNTYISKSTADINAQKKWIRNYKNKELNNKETYINANSY